MVEGMECTQLIDNQEQLRRWLHHQDICSRIGRGQHGKDTHPINCNPLFIKELEDAIDRYPRDIFVLCRLDTTLPLVVRSRVIPTLIARGLVSVFFKSARRTYYKRMHP